jgi:hypothetical protein
VRLFSQVGPVVLYVAALYYRFARHDALRFYVFFGAAAIVACFYLFVTATTERAVLRMPPSPFRPCLIQIEPGTQDWADHEVGHFSYAFAEFFGLSGLRLIM